MNKKIYSASYSPFRNFSRAEWSIFNKEIFSISEDISSDLIKEMNEPLTLDEINDIYIPMVNLLEIHFSNYKKLHEKRDLFFGNYSNRIPYIIGIAGSVAVGKTTTAKVLKKLLSLLPEAPKVELVTTDGFLFSNKELETKNILNKKGFPESYDAKKLLKFLASIKSGREVLEAPIYSHIEYDVIENKTERIEKPDIIIVEGINVLQVNKSNIKRHLFVSDFFDFSIYVDAKEEDIKNWYIERFKTLQKKAFINPKSYFHKYIYCSEQELEEKGKNVWEEINKPNLINNILPTRFRSDLIIEKGLNHKTKNIRIRKI